MSFSLPRLATLSITLTALVAPAFAEPPPRYYAEDPQASVRRGWNIGGSLGAGEISCEGPGCDAFTEAGSFDLQVGHMLRPRLRVVGDLWVMAHRDDDLTVSHTIVTGGLQLWVINRLWLRGGIGLARAGFDYDRGFVEVSDETETVFGVAGTIGFEIMSRRRFALDVQLRGGTGFYDDNQAHNGALALGVTWY
jgi:hypothetical protein